MGRGLFTTLIITGCDGIYENETKTEEGSIKLRISTTPEIRQFDTFATFTPNPTVTPYGNDKFQKLEQFLKGTPTPARLDVSPFREQGDNRVPLDDS